MKKFKNMLTLQQYRYQQYQDNSNYKKHMTFTVTCSKNIEVKKLMLALNELVQQQPMLRTLYEIKDGQPLLYESNFFPYIELVPIDYNAENFNIKKYIENHLSEGLNANEPQFTFKIFDCNDFNLLLLNFSYLIMDEAHINKLFKQLSYIYSNISSEISLKASPLKLSYLLNNKIENHRTTDLAIGSYWRVKETMQAHYRYMPIRFYSHANEIASKRMKMRNLSRSKLISSIYLANYFLSLNHDITLGLMQKCDIKNECSPYVYPDMNLNVLNLKVEPDISIKSIVDECEVMLQCMSENKSSILENSMSVDMTQFETVIYNSGILEAIEIGGELCEIQSIYRNDTEHNIAFYINQNSVDMVYNENNFDTLTIQTYFNLTQSIYQQISNDIEQSISNLNLLLDPSANLSIQEMNQTNTDIVPMVLSERFEKTVEKHKDKAALIFKDTVLTYDMLNKKVNEVAHYLQNANIQYDSCVCILAERSIEMIIAILGTIKAGASYVAIDPEAPQSRIDYIVDDANPKIILLHGVSYKHDIPVKYINEIHHENQSNPSHINHLDDIANIVYTSGTTGKPKGTLIRHRSIDRLVIKPNYVSLNSDTVILLSGTIAFDAATFEIFGSLLNGGTLVITTKAELLNLDELRHAIRKYEVNTMWLTSSLFNQIVSEKIETLESLSYLLIGGEALNPKWVNLLNQRARHPQIINGYGPTENTTFTTTFPISEIYESSIPIGRPINRTQVYVMQNNQLCGFGVPGELHIAGDGLAKGYLHQKEQTTEKFINNPFNEGILYKSGDLVRLRPDGNLDYIGRKDKQVKIRGFRIELSEIEKTLMTIEGVNKAVVIVRTEEQEKQLSAYYEGPETLSHTLLREKLAMDLPHYMIPNAFKKITRIPTTVNGKIDEAALPEININSQRVYDAPKNELEAYLCGVFETVLHIENVSTTDHFFELGGHSLRATLAVNRIEQKLNKKLTISELMQNPTVSSLAKLLDNKKVTEIETLPFASHQSNYEVSPAQQSMYFLWQLNQHDTVYNVPFLWRLSSRLNITQLRQAAEALVKRHEILRTQFIIKNHVLKQTITDNFNIDFNTIETMVEDEQVLIQQLTDPFDLEKGNLFRMRYIITPNHDYLFIDTHHIVNDGMSNTILLKELNHLYQDKPLPKVEHQYKDYSEWLKHRDLTIQQRYWHSVFNDEIPVLNLPTDYPRPNTKQTNGNMIRYTFNRQLTTEVKKYLQQHNVTDFMFFMSAVMVLLSKYSRQQDIVVGSVISARTHKDTESMLGMFANTLVYRGFPYKDKAWETFLKEMKQVSLEAYEHQDYPFERLVDELIEERDASRNPLFDVMLVLQNNESSYAHFGHSELTHIMPLSTTAKFDLSFIIEEDNGQYVLNLEYCTNLFNQETIEIMGQQLEYLIQTIVTADDLTLAQLSLCSEETKKWIINEINDEETPMLQHHNIVALFEEQVLEKPDNPAICFEDIELSYAQLEQWVDSIIYELKASGVETGQTIALYMQRGIPMIASMLAIGKMGCTYVPIDPTNPQMRTAYILQDAQVSLILLHNTTIDTDLMCIDVSTIQLRDLKFDCIDVVNQQALYIIYTSGTTGNPKGVTINHKNVGNLVLSWYKALDLSGDEVFMQYANYVFDASVWEIYTALSHGHKLVIANDHERLDVRQLEMLIKQKDINVASLPVQVCNMMSNYHIKRLVTGGSVSTPAFVEKVSRYSDLYFNAYGPTEATVISTYWSWTCNNKHSKVNRVPIGKPITNVQVYIMEGDQLCGVNEPGELCIAGAQLSNGYINQVEMTESCFEDNPIGHGQLYHSGDLARYLPDGNIEFLGRLDDQVKVRGYRIELSEIENVIISHPDVVDCAVIVEDEKRKSNIVAYYVGDVNKEVDIINKIRKTLPQYMVPNHIRHLEEIPLTKNGKLNRDQLPRELGNHHRYVAPRTYNEQILQQIFCDVLQRNQLSIDDDFFELGGSSLDVMAVVAHLKKYNILINMQDIYQNKTIRHILNEDQNMSGITVKVPDNLSQLNKIIACNQLPIKESLSKESLGNVCLTGATGFLGAYILESLQTKADKIVCVVRSENSLTATEKLQSNLLCYFDSKKVIQIMNRVDLCVGDFTEDLKLETYQIDTIIHAGARTDHFGETHMFNQSNVESTKHLIKVAQQLNIKFIYISTISIGSIFPESHEDNRFSETDLYKGQVIDSPYTLSKFYGELAVLNAIEGGLNAKIIRVGNLTSSTTGKINMKNMKTNRFSIIMKNLLMLDEVGETVAKSYVEFSFVDIVAQAVVNIAMLSNEYAIFHVFNPYQITIQELLNTFKEENKPITIVDDGTFHNILNEQQMYEVIGLNSSTQAQQPAQIDAAFTNEILRNMGVYWQKLNKGWLCEWHKRIKTIFKEGI